MLASDMQKAKRRARLEIERKKKFQTPDKFDKPSLGSKAILALLRAKRRVTGPPKKKGQKRTQQITGRLEAAGLSKREIDRLRGKRKK
ncbi:hypothetical protein LCGC14_0588640 [marine sediment metagenome]|uniref:Uncharacterized protein n=1 Tax=marine sediment metagenome TaxID=412755 RepID=A0A0F9RE92_9ZZZZ